MDGNIRLTLILLGIGLMVHAGYVYSTCEMMTVLEYLTNECGVKKEQAELYLKFGQNTLAASLASSLPSPVAGCSRG